MQNKVCLVTGATDGIGRVTARSLAEKGAHVILVGRNEAKGTSVLSDIKRETGSDKLEFETADLSHGDAIRDLAERLAARLPRLDVLINNAGALFQRRTLTREGIEMTFALNHLGYFHLTGRLLESMKQSPAARIVNVSSMAHRGPQLNFGDLGGEQRYSGWRAYQQSKLANILFTYRLAESLRGTNIAANCLHPGFVASKFGHNNRGWLRWGLVVAQKLMAISEDAGARTSVHVATNPELTGVTGRYFVKSQRAESSGESHDPMAQARLWEISEEMTDCHYP